MEIKGFFFGFVICILVLNFDILFNICEWLDDLFFGNKLVGLSDFVLKLDKFGDFKIMIKVKNFICGFFKIYMIIFEIVFIDNKILLCVVL